MSLRCSGLHEKAIGQVPDHEVQTTQMLGESWHPFEMFSFVIDGTLFSVLVQSRIPDVSGIPDPIIQNLRCLFRITGPVKPGI
jgi:hypothetical protein